MNAIESDMVLDEVFKRSARSTEICRAIVSRVMDSGEIIVNALGRDDLSFSCDVLLGRSCPVLNAGDSVLVLFPSSPHERGVVLGLVGPYVPPLAQSSEMVERREVEAGESLLLKCGESSIELRKDGKVLLKGKDIVSNARRVQRIKGGSVAIN